MKRCVHGCTRIAAANKGNLEVKYNAEGEEVAAAVEADSPETVVPVHPNSILLSLHSHNN